MCASALKRSAISGSRSWRRAAVAGCSVIFDWYSYMLELKPPYPPMEAELVDDIPTGPGWQYEPKWDGFRCLAFRDGRDVYLQSKAEKPLARYFPEVVAGVL